LIITASAANRLRRGRLFLSVNYITLLDQRLNYSTERARLGRPHEKRRLRMGDMPNLISGRVTLKESGVGIPDLLVVVYDADPNTRSEDELPPAISAAPPSSLPPDPSAGDRLGSVLTKLDGGFELVYDDSEFQIRNPQERRPDLVIKVLAPDEPGVVPETNPLYVSTVVANAGKNEQRLIHFTADQLLKAGISPPSSVGQSAEPAKGIVDQLTAERVQTEALNDGALAVNRQRVESYRAQVAGFATKIRPALTSALSAVPTNMIDPERFVAPGESPFTKSTATIQKGIKDILNTTDPAKRAPIRGYIILNDKQKEILRSQTAPDGSVPVSAVEAIAAKNGSARPTTFLQRSPALPVCSPETAAQRRAADTLNNPVPGSPSPPDPGPVVPGPGISPVTAEDIPLFIARLLDPLTAPEEELLTGLTPAATRESVQASVQELDFAPSPADVPAFHDFSNLQIAFQHVWQEAIDKGALHLAQDAYETIVELGGDPHRPEYETLHPLIALQSESGFALRSIRSAAAPIVRDHRQGGTNSSNGSGGVVVIGPAGLPPAQAPPSQSFDPTIRLPALLTELQQKLREPYAFTVFAANRQERSVNFGILNTFRQVWTPLSYQAGALVKSIPLAPKQAQKVIITRKITKKRTAKEVENNLRVLKEETSQTSRAEQEIANRASRKTDTDVTNTATANFEAGSDTLTTSFKQDATKSSDDIKKSFHEAVFKSAQEFKNERTTEVTTEETESYEYNETTEISNPNDEIAVTFLFYELQRRYRLHECLYRVRPVVLVAQEFPDPDDIDQAWLITHDWILKRSILDDSFLPVLDSLCESAGEESAIAEMEINIAQQREIVANLQQELGVARQNEATLRNMLGSAVVHKSSGGILGDLFGVAGDVVSHVEDAILGSNADQSQNNRQAAQDSADRAADQARDLLFRIEREVTALNALLESYTKALQAHHTRLTQIARLLVHVKDNIFYYMQAVWTHEPPDQRYFRLHNVPIPTLTATARHFHIDFANFLPVSTTAAHLSLPRFGGAAPGHAYPIEPVTTFSDQFDHLPLAEVADLDNLLGFKGNYMIFPLNESNPLTDFMMAPYLDEATGELLDPSDPAGWSPDEFADYVSCLKAHLTPEEFDTIKPQLKQQYEAILSAPHRSDDVLVVPTNSLFIEALPAEHSLIERFKRDHRMIDVKDAQSKVREKELSNILRAARLLANEHEDPKIDKKVLIEGLPNAVVPAGDL
jgi:hypothetical protein